MGLAIPPFSVSGPVPVHGVHGMVYKVSPGSFVLSDFRGRTKPPAWEGPNLGRPGTSGIFRPGDDFLIGKKKKRKKKRETGGPRHVCSPHLRPPRFRRFQCASIWNCSVFVRWASFGRFGPKWKKGRASSEIAKQAVGWVRGLREDHRFGAWTRKVCWGSPRKRRSDQNPRGFPATSLFTLYRLPAGRVGPQDVFGKKRPLLSRGLSEIIIARAS